MRILYQSMTPVHHLPNYADALTRHALKLCSAGTEIVLNGMPPEWFEGSSPTEVYRYPYAKHAIASHVIGIGRKAQADGYDAYVLGSFSEPFLPELRSVLDIPVVGMAESCALVACSLAEYYAYVSLSPISALRLKSIVKKHALDARVTGFHALPRPFNEHELNAAFNEPRALIDAFTQIATEAVEEGADLVVPAEGVMTEVLFMSGINNIAGATVMDCVGVTLCHAEMLVNLKQRAGMGVGRRWAYLKPPKEMMDQFDTASART
jgi:hypothetical protein